MYKIFQENRALFFPDIDESQLCFDVNGSGCDAYDSILLCEFLAEWLSSSEQTDVIVQGVSPTDVVSALLSTFKWSPAAGGVVVEGAACVTIERAGVPDLPKGHVELGESPETAALREVMEETGLDGLLIERALPSTWHVYLRNGIWELKKTHWYEMRCKGLAAAKPQTEEGITAVKTTGKDTMDGFLDNTFRSIREILGKDMRQIVSK